MSSAPAHRPALIPAWVWITLPFLLGAWLRTRNLMGPEPFVDEGANILTALDPRVRSAFEPLAQGRPWLIYLFQPAGWWPAQALATARLMSAGAGLATMAALGWTLYQLAGRTAALFGLWLWAVLPLAVFHERLALQDPFVTALLAWSVALMTAGSLKKSAPAIWFLAAGSLFGTAFLLKISALFALPWLGLFYFVLQRQVGRPWVDGRLSYLALGAFIPLVSLGRDLLQLGSRLDRYHALPNFMMADALTAAAARVPAWLSYYAGYHGWPLLILWSATAVLAVRQRHSLALGVGLGWLTSLVVTALGYQQIFARYLLPDQLPLIIFLALAGSAGGKIIGQIKILSLSLVMLVLAFWGRTSWQIGTEPRTANIPATEITQYVTGPWSGRGLTEVCAYLHTYADQHQVRCVVLTHRYLRPGCYGLLLAERADPRFSIVPFTIYEPSDLTATRAGLRAVTAGQPVAFFILYEGSLYPPPLWLEAPASPAQRVAVVPRGPGEAFTLYQFTP